MENYAWILWTVLGVTLVIAEVFTPGFVLLWFGVGALAAAFASLVGLDSLTLQFLIFAIVSVGLTAASGVHYLYRGFSELNAAQA